LRQKGNREKKKGNKKKEKREEEIKTTKGKEKK
jgi:hypothetical protein